MKYAYFDPHDGKVLQWIDTETMSYNLPDTSMLHQCTDAEWELQNQGEMMVKNGAILPYVAPEIRPSPEQVIAQYESALNEHLDSVARQHRYDDRFTFALRSGYTGPYQADGKAFGTWMDTCNAQAYKLLEDVQAGRTTMPSIEDFIAGLPPFVMHQLS